MLENYRISEKKLLKLGVQITVQRKNMRDRAMTFEAQRAASREPRAGLEGGIKACKEGRQGILPNEAPSEPHMRRRLRGRNTSKHEKDFEETQATQCQRQGDDRAPSARRLREVGRRRP